MPHIYNAVETPQNTPGTRKIVVSGQTRSRIDHDKITCHDGENLLRALRDSVHPRFARIMRFTFKTKKKNVTYFVSVVSYDGHTCAYKMKLLIGLLRQLVQCTGQLCG